MYPEDDDPDGIDAAKQVGADCPVRTQSLLLALRLHEDDYGVWRGKSPEERRSTPPRSRMPGKVDNQAKAS